MAEDFFADVPQEKQQDFFADVPQAAPEAGRGMAERITTGFRGGFGEEPIGMSPETQAKYPMWAPFQPLVAGADVLWRLAPGAAGAVAGWGAGLVEQNPNALVQVPGLLNKAEADRLQRDLTIMGQGAMIEPGMGPAAAAAAAREAMPAEQRLARAAREGAPAPAQAPVTPGGVRDVITGEPVEKLPETVAPTTPEQVAVPPEQQPDLFAPQALVPRAPEIPRAPEVPRPPPEMPREAPPPPEPAAPAPEERAPEAARAREAPAPPAEAPPDFFYNVPMEEPPARVTERIPEAAPPPAPEEAPPTPRAAKLPKAKKPQSLLQWIAQDGGISSKDPLIQDVRDIIGRKNVLIPGYGALIRETGKPLDRVLENAIEQRFIEDPGFFDPSQPRVKTIPDLLNAIEEERRGRPQVRRTEEAQAAAARRPDEYTQGVEAQATRARQALQDAGFRPQEVETEPLYEAAQMLYRGEATDPVAAYDQAAVRITEREFAQREGVRGAGEEMYPPGRQRGKPVLEEAVPPARPEAPGARPTRKPPRQEIPAEDLNSARNLLGQEVGRGTEILDSIPLRKFLDERDYSHLTDTPLRIANWIKGQFSELVGDTPVHFITERDLQTFGGNPNYPARTVNGLWQQWQLPGDRERNAIFMNADFMWGGRPQDATWAALHESAHAAIANNLDANKPLKRAVRNLMDYLEPRLKTVKGKRPYALTDEHEFLSEILSNPEVQTALEQARAPLPLRQMIGRMAKGDISAWDAFVELTRRAIGFPARMTAPLDAILNTTRGPSILDDALGLAARGMQGRVPVQERLPGFRAEKPPEEVGVEGKPQLVIPGAERRVGEALQRKAEAPLKPKAEQKPLDFGLFGDSTAQQDLFDKVGKAVFGRPEKVRIAAPERPRPGGMLARIARGYKETFQPELISPDALKADAQVARWASQTEQERDATIREGLQRERMWAKQPVQEAVDFMRAVEEGSPVKPQFRAAAQVYRGLLDKAYEMEKQWGSKAGFINDYFPHIWERPPKGKLPINEYFQSPAMATWFQKARTFDFIQEGLDAGYKLKTNNPEALVRERLLAGVDMRQRMMLLDRLRGMDLARSVREINDADVTKRLSRDGWMTIRAPDRQEWMLHPDIQPLWKNGVEARGLWANQGLAGDAFRAWMSLKNVWVPIKLSLSAFHPLHVAQISMASHWARAADHLLYDLPRDLAKANLGRVAGDLGRAVASVGQGLSPYSGIGKRGRAAWLLGPEARTPEGRWAVQVMNEGGFSPMMSEQLRIDAGKKLQQAMRDWAPLKAAYQLPRWVIQKLQAPIFEHWIPHLKAGAYLQDAAALLRRYPELMQDPVKRGVALRALAKSMDNRFGEMFYKSMFWNRGLKDLGIATHLSLGWQMGFLREFGGAAMEAITRPIGTIKSPNEARIVARSATNKIKFAAIYLGLGAATAGIMTKLLSGQDPEGMDYIFPRSGGVNPDGSPRRLTTMSYLREFPMAMKHVQEYGGTAVPGKAWAQGLRDMWFNKLLAGPFVELYNNRNYFGQEIYDEQAPAYKQLQQVAQYIGGQQFMPMSVTGAQRVRETGGTKGEEALSYLGFGPAPKYAERTATQNRIAFLFDKYVAPKVRPYQEPEETKAIQLARNKVLMAQQRGDKEGERAAKQEALKAGMSAASVNKIGIVSSDQTMFQRLPPGPAISVLENATPQERKRYFPYASAKAKTLWKQRHPELSP